MSTKFPYQKYEILPSLYLSKFPQQWDLHGITHVLNMCREPHPPNPSRTYKHIELDDIDDITPHIGTIISYISSAMQQNGRVLIHCALGLNRSAAATIAYLCHHHHNNIISAEALHFVKERKSDVRPGAIFLGQINQYFGRQGDTSEDALVGFHRRLEMRKKGLLEATKEGTECL
jgi:protein-tyrosine phosphatase